MNHDLIRVYSDETKKVKFVTESQLAFLKSLGYERQPEPIKLEPLDLTPKSQITKKTTKDAAKA